MRANWFSALLQRTGAPDRAPAPRLGEEGASPRALVVDDSDVARRALAAVLARAGFEVVEASFARQVDVLLDTHAPAELDVVLMDLHLPDGTGIEACARIKLRSGWEDVPVIVVTASDDDEDLTLAFAAGATDYLTKPARDFELLARVHAALRLKHEMTRRRAREVELERLNRRLREQAAELSIAKGALQELNQELEHRVRAQVDEIVARARQVEELNAQLRVQVRERSHELAEALRRVSRDRQSRRRAISAGKILGNRVQLVRHLADGGMGTIYVGHDLITGAPVAVKLLDSTLGCKEKDLQRFINEAAASAEIAHPAIVKTFHVDVTRDGDLFLIMELVNGVTLEKVLAKGRLSSDWCAAVGRVVADALAAAHRVNVIHRDLKPANLMICRTLPGVRVLDFGISKIRSWADRVTLTQTAGLLGTPAYMAPEQIEDASAVTPATDVYALGAVMFEVVTGARAFSDLRTRLLRVNDQPPPIRELAPDAHPGLAALIERCLSQVPAMRPSASQLASQLSAIASDLHALPPQQLFDFIGKPPASVVTAGEI